jgi:hypothetical protein
MTQRYFNSISENINYNILRGKITKALCDFAIESIEPIKDKATTQRVIPAVKHNETGETLYKAWQKDFEIDGYKGYFSVSLGKHDYNGRKVLRIYSHAYNEAKNAYAPEPTIGEVWKINEDGEQTWQTFIDELQNLKSNYEHLPTPEQVEAYLNECEKIKKAYADFEEKRGTFSVLGGEYLNEAPSRWRVRG